MGRRGSRLGVPGPAFLAPGKRAEKCHSGDPEAAGRSGPGGGGAYNESKIGEAELSTLGTPLVLRGTVADIYYIVCIYIYIYMWRTPKQT